MKTLIGVEMAREEDILWLVFVVIGALLLPDDPSETELSASQSSSLLRTPEEVIKQYGEYFCQHLRNARRY